MDSPFLPAVIVGSIIALHLVVYALPRFHYELSASVLKIERHILGRIPLGRWEIPLSDIREARRSVLAIPVMARKLGGLWSPLRGVVLVSKRRGRFFARVYYLTPENPDEFVLQINAIVGAPPKGLAHKPDQSARGRRFTAPLWLTDLLAILTGALLWFALVFAPSHLQGWAVGTAEALGATMCAWMIVDCFLVLKRTAERRYLVWLAAMFPLFPCCWLYYVIEYRPRRAWGGSPHLPGGAS